MSLIGPLEKRLIANLQKTWLRYRSSTYLVMIVAGFEIALLLSIVVITFYPTIDDLKWFLLGLIIYSVWGFGVLYGLEFFRHSSFKEALLVLTCALAGGIFWVFMIGPRLDTRLGDVLLFSFFVGWILGWSTFGIPMFKHKRRLESEHGVEPSAQEIEYRYADIWRMNRLAVPLAIFLILISDGVMLWMVLDVTTDPSYGTSEDIYSQLMVLLIFGLPQLISILLITYAWGEARIRFFMLAAMMSGFSFAAPLSVLAEILLWRAHRIGGWPW